MIVGCFETLVSRGDTWGISRQGPFPKLGLESAPPRVGTRVCVGGEEKLVVVGINSAYGVVVGSSVMRVQRLSWTLHPRVRRLGTGAKKRYHNRPKQDAGYLVN